MGGGGRVPAAPPEIGSRRKGYPRGKVLVFPVLLLVRHLGLSALGTFPVWPPVLALRKSVCPQREVGNRHALSE